MRVLICGGRGFSDRPAMLRFFAELVALADGRDVTPVIIHGGAQGADRLADRIATALQFPVQRFPAEWDRHGPAAGPIRNRQMLEQGKPDMVVAFPGGKGTAHMVSAAEDAGVPVQKVGWE